MDTTDTQQQAAQIMAAAVEVGIAMLALALVASGPTRRAAQPAERAEVIPLRPRRGPRAVRPRPAQVIVCPSAAHRITVGELRGLVAHIRTDGGDAA